jgi:hypothetical protein
MLVNHMTDSRLWAPCEAVIWSRTRWVAGNMANVKAEAREARLKAALRENLKRRKAQARGRDEADRDPGAVANDRPGAAKTSGN